MHISKNLFISLPLVLILILASPLILQPQNLTIPEIAKNASPSIVQFLIFDKLDEDFSGYATGFVIYPGKVLTNAHIVKNTRYISVWDDLVNPSETLEVSKILKIDKEHDLALLEVLDLDRPFLQIEDKEDVLVGQSVIVIGYPLGYDKVVSDGIISSINNYKVGITAPISDGSSGSPILNQKGHVIGIITSSFTEGQNMNIAVSIETVKKFLSQPYDPKEISMKSESANLEEHQGILFQKITSYSSKIFNFIFKTGEWIFFFALKLMSIFFFIFLLIILPKAILNLIRTKFGKVILISFVLGFLVPLMALILLIRKNWTVAENPLLMISFIMIFGPLTYYSIKYLFEIKLVKSKKGS